MMSLHLRSALRLRIIGPHVSFSTARGGHRFGADRKRRAAAAAANAGVGGAAFAELARGQLARVCSCVDALRASNPSFTCTHDAEAKSGERVDIACEDLRLELVAKVEKQQIQVFSTVSGVLDYKIAGGKWVGVADGHDMEGLLMRDLLRVCVGCPTF
eukprot:g7646.t1